MTARRRELLGRVTNLVERCQNLDIAAPVDTGYFSVEPALVQEILDLFAETAAVLRDIGDYFELGGALAGGGVDTEATSDSLEDIGASISTELATREVSDLAFMGCSEILDLSRELKAAVKEKNFWKTIAHADAGLGRAARALIPIESAMREYEGLPAMRRRFENLEDSIEIRRQYGMLWRAAQRAGKPRPEDAKAAIRKIGHRIAILRRLRIYPYLRIDDRLSIRKLQKRILAYLEDSAAEDGLQLWNDVVAFFGLLRQINNRHELRVHDRQLVLSAHFELSKRAANSDRIPSTMLERLEPLIGLDDELDGILLSPAGRRSSECLVILERLRDQLLQAELPTPVTL